jgi:uncharacterized protein with HEPN domain
MKDRSVRLRLNDIVRAIDGAVATLGTSDFETFRRTYHMPRTIERCIEIVSEASRHLPPELKRKYPSIPWQPIAGIGNVLRHDYDIVDERIIWEVATVHFPELRKVTVELMAQLPEENE